VRGLVGHLPLSGGGRGQHQQVIDAAPSAQLSILRIVCRTCALRNAVVRP